MKIQPKEIARQYAEAVWNEKNLTAIEQLVHDRVHIHSLLGDYSGKFAMQQVVETWLAAFSNLQVKEEQVMAEGDLVSIQWQAQGTHQGPFKGYEPTGKRVHYKGTTVYRIQDGLIVEYWAYLDMQYLLQQLVNSFTNLQFETERLQIRSIRSDDARLIQSFKVQRAVFSIIKVGVVAYEDVGSSDDVLKKHQFIIVFSRILCIWAGSLHRKSLR